MVIFNSTFYAIRLSAKFISYTVFVCSHPYHFIVFENRIFVSCNTIFDIVYEQARRDALFADAAQELAMAALLKGLRFSKYSILYDVVDSEFPLEVAVEDQEAFVKHLLPLVDNVYSIYDLTDDDFAQSPDYDQLYTELTGAVAIFIESNGVQ